MWAVIITELPLGVTPAVLQRCIEDALGERLIFHQQAQISDDEALVYLPSREIQNRLSSVVVRCGGVKIQINKATIDETQQWILSHGRKLHQNIAQNTQKYSKQHKREQRKINLQEKEREKRERERERERERQKEREKEKKNTEEEDDESETDLLIETNIETAGGRLSPPAPSGATDDEDDGDADDDDDNDDDNDINDINDADGDNDEQEELLSLYNQVPIFLSEHPNRIIWYQYLIFVNRGQSSFYVTYPAEWCWDIEGQWLKFQEHYAINPSEAEKVDSRFLICDPQTNDSSRCMVGDLLNMRIRDNNSGKEFEFKRTKKLIGTLIAYGQISFERYYQSKTKEIFLYDRVTGYQDGVGGEEAFSVGDYVVFEAWWNKDDYDNYHYDITQKINTANKKSKNKNIHFDMFAFNVKRANANEQQELFGSSKANYAPLNYHNYHMNMDMNMHMNSVNMNSNNMMSNANASLAYYDPLVADDFKGQRFSGLVISLSKPDKIGFIVCFPHKDDKGAAAVDNKDKEDKEKEKDKESKSMTLLFHERFMHNPSDRHQLCVNQWLEFSIGVNPCNYGQGIFGYVAMDIVVPKTKQIILMMNNPLIPITLPPVSRLYRGRIIVAPTSILSKGCGFIYNEFENTMTRLEIQKSEQIADYHVHSYLKFNEKKIYLNKNNDDNPGDPDNDDADDDKKRRDEYKIIALDPVIVKRTESKQVESYYTADNFVRYKADQYVLGRKLRINEGRNIEFKYINLTKKESTTHSDIYLIIEQSETYLNAFLNTKGGGAIVFGIQSDGKIVGQNAMTKAKRDYIVDAIHERAKHFRPAVPSDGEYFVIQFKEVIDSDGFTMSDNYVLILSVANLYAEKRETNIKFETSNHQIYEKEKNSQLNRLNPQHQSRSYSKQKLSTINPQFTAFRNIDHDESSNEEEDDEKDHNSDDIHNAAPGGANNSNYSNSAAPGAAAANPNNMRITVRYTTPSLNAKPIPPNTETGRDELAKRVQLKLNEMMMVEEYMLDPRWQFILTMASSSLYNAQKTTWMLMKNLETEKVRKNMCKQQEQMNNKVSPVQNTSPIISASSSSTGIASGASASNPMYRPFQKQMVYPNEKRSGNLNNNKKKAVPAQQAPPLQPQKQQDDDGNPNNCIIVKSESAVNVNDKMSTSEVDSYGLPILPDKSKYKAVAMEYCQKIGWKRPLENVQCIGTGYIATVSFGKPGQEISAQGNGLRQKNAIYEAYIKLVPIVIPKNAAVELMMKWVPGYRKQEKVSTATIAQSGQSIMKHPKSVLLEWAQKNSLAPPKTSFSEFVDSTRNMRMWTAKVTFCGKTIEFKGSKKKDAESKCFQELLNQVMDGNFKR